MAHITKEENHGNTMGRNFVQDFRHRGAVSLVLVYLCPSIVFHHVQWPCAHHIHKFIPTNSPVLLLSCANAKEFGNSCCSRDMPFNCSFEVEWPVEQYALSKWCAIGLKKMESSMYRVVTYCWYRMQISKQSRSLTAILVANFKWTAKHESLRVLPSLLRRRAIRSVL